MNLLRDLRFGVRILARNRLFAAAALTLIALGIGATTAVFSVVRAVLLQPLPYSDPNGIVVLRADSSRGIRQSDLTTQEFNALRDRGDIFEDLATINGVNANLTGVDDMEVVPAVSVTDSFFRVLRVSPFLGRPLSFREDSGPNQVTGIAVSYELWQRRWHGDPGLVGREIEVNNFRATVVAVMPRGFEIYLGPGVSVSRHVDIFFPEETRDGTPTVPNFPAVGRLAPGTSIAAAQAALSAFAIDFVAAHRIDYRTGALRLTVVRLADDVVHDVRPALLAMAGAVAFVLLVACANVTNLLLARACARTRELSVRIAIGASRWQIVRQLAVESLVLAAFGGIGGVVVAAWAVRGLMYFAPATLPHHDAVGVSGDVVLFALAISLASSLVFGMVPAWQATRPDVAGSLKADPAARSRITRGVLVAGQLALSLMLLVGAGLMLRTFVVMRQTRLGYDPANVASMRIQISFRRFSDRQARLVLYKRVVDAVRGIPGVTDVGLVSPAPLDGVTIYRRIALGPDAPEIAAYQPTAFPGYFDAMRIRLRDGRDLSDADKTTPDRTPIVIDEVLARQLFPGARAVGRRVLLSPHATSEQWAEIVGVVDHVRAQDVRIDGLPQIYVSYEHRQMVNVQLLARTRTDPHVLAGVIKQTVERLGPGRPVSNVSTLEDLVDAGRADTRFALLVLSAFAAIALVLTAVGVCGAVAYSAARRTREIAVRLALGATSQDIVRLVIWEGAVWIGAGLAAGALGALGLSRSLASLLVDVKPTDAATFVTVAVLLAIVALVAAALPAVRAVRVDPMLALRSE